MSLFNFGREQKPVKSGGLEHLYKEIHERMEQKKTPAKETDKSIFGGKPFFSKGTFGERIERDPKSDIYRKTGFEHEKRKDLAGKFILKKMGPNIDPRDIKAGREQLALGSRGAYKNLSRETRKDLKKLIDNLPGNKS